MKKLTAAEIARLVGGELRGDPNAEVRGVASLERAGPGLLCFFANPRYRELALSVRPAVLLVPEALPSSVTQVIVSDPYMAFVQVMQEFQEIPSFPPGIHPAAVVDPAAELAPDVHVGPFAVIGPKVRIERGSVIEAGCVIGERCEIGSASILHPRVTLYPGVCVGARVIIHSGTVIGADGFGYVITPSGHIKKPQVGTVVIEHDVEIGANCTIDRAMLDETIIGAGTKLDNLVHLAHNVRIGQHCILLAGVVVGGSVTIGDRVLISGNTSIKDNITIGSGAIIIGHSGITADVGEGDTRMGFPDMPFSQAKRVFARLKQLPDLFSRVRQLEKMLSKKEGGGEEDKT